MWLKNLNFRETFWIKCERTMKIFKKLVHWHKFFLFHFFRNLVRDHTSIFKSKQRRNVQTSDERWRWTKRGTQKTFRGAIIQNKVTKIDHISNLFSWENISWQQTRTTMATSPKMSGSMCLTVLGYQLPCELDAAKCRYFFHGQIALR